MSLFVGYCAPFAFTVTITTSTTTNMLTTTTTTTTVCSSSLAGALASFLTSPLDLAKLRLQVDRSRQRDASVSAFRSSEYATYKSFFDVLKKTFVNEGGVKGLYRGAFARVSVNG